MWGTSNDVLQCMPHLLAVAHVLALVEADQALEVLVTDAIAAVVYFVLLVGQVFFATVHLNEGGGL